MLAACTLGGRMTQRGIPAAGTVVETRVVTTVDTQWTLTMLRFSLNRAASGAGSKETVSEWTGRQGQEGGGGKMLWSCQAAGYAAT